eukprot:scaffold80755_cov61-Phaeocystis_antarctica.AAC.4
MYTRRASQRPVVPPSQLLAPALHGRARAEPENHTGSVQSTSADMASDSLGKLQKGGKHFGGMTYTRQIPSFIAKMNGGKLSLHVRPGASVLYVRATRTSLLRAVRTRGAGQLAPGAGTTVRTSYAYQPRPCRGKSDDEGIKGALERREGQEERDEREDTEEERPVMVESTDAMISKVRHRHPNPTLHPKPNPKPHPKPNPKPHPEPHPETHPEPNPGPHPGPHSEPYPWPHPTPRHDLEGAKATRPTRGTRSGRSSRSGRSALRRLAPRLAPPTAQRPPRRLAATYADTYVPEPPCCTYRLRVPASCVLYVPKAQGGLPQGPHAQYVRRTRTGLGRAVRTAYRGTTGRHSFGAKKKLQKRSKASAAGGVGASKAVRNPGLLSFDEDDEP